MYINGVKQQTRSLPTCYPPRVVVAVQSLLETSSSSGVHRTGGTKNVRKSMIRCRHWSLRADAVTTTTQTTAKKSFWKSRARHHPPSTAAHARGLRLDLRCRTYIFRWPRPATRCPFSGVLVVLIGTKCRFNNQSEAQRSPK